MDLDNHSPQPEPTAQPPPKSSRPKTKYIVIGVIVLFLMTIIGTGVGYITARINAKADLSGDILPPESSSTFCHCIVLHGRAVCDARKPRCESCCVKHLCQFYEMQNPEQKGEKQV